MRPPATLAVLVITGIATMGLSPPDFDRTDIIHGIPQIIDGDTLVIDGQRIFLFGIDAPEIGQSCRIFGLNWPCGDRAGVWLRRFIGTGPVRCLPNIGTPVDDRGAGLKAMCFNDKTLNLSAAMVGEGMAVPNSIDGPWFQTAGVSARFNNVGLWAGDFVDPADWRRGRRLKPLKKLRDTLLP